MKTLAAVLGALLATGGAAFAHGNAGGTVTSSAPVTSPGSFPVMTPIVRGAPIVTHVNGSVFANIPAKKQPIPQQGPSLFYFPGTWDPRICKAPQWLFTPEWVVSLNGNGGTCATSSLSTAAAASPIPFWLPPAFMW